jgi:hypothetical protein
MRPAFGPASPKRDAGYATSLSFCGVLALAGVSPPPRPCPQGGGELDARRPLGSVNSPQRGEALSATGLA